MFVVVFFCIFFKLPLHLLLLSVHWPVSQAVQSDYGVQQCPCLPCSLRALPPLLAPAAEDCVHVLQQQPPPPLLRSTPIAAFP